MSGRFWISERGTEYLGVDVLGTPLVSDGDGVEPMTEISALITGVTLVEEDR